jgi:hypothetical protein
MQAFRFRLQRVLDWQLKVCRIEEENVRLHRVAVADTESRMAQLRADLLSVEQEALGRSALLASELAALDRFRLMSLERARRLTAQRQEQLQQLERQLQKLMAERRRLELLGKFRERALTDYTVAAGRELEALALDNYLARWVRSA